ncbi:MAG: hypothetical protein WC358_12045 [Ignavibacteria bacterium]|jgi:hypothetical protein
MELLKRYINWFLVLLIIIVLIFVIKQIFPSKNQNRNNITIKDTNLIVRYENEIKQDTVIKWYEKIIYVKSEPDKIYIQKTDTLFIERTKELDLILQIKKENRKLIIKAVNQNGNVLKEYVYEEIGKDFVAISQKNNIFVKTKNIYWNRINSIFNVQWSMFNEKKINYNLGVETGISYKDKIDLSAGLLYSPENKDLLINTNFKIKF